MALRREVLTLDVAALTNASIIAAGGGLPRRITTKPFTLSGMLGFSGNVPGQGKTFGWMKLAVDGRLIFTYDSNESIWTFKDGVESWGARVSGYSFTASAVDDVAREVYAQARTANKIYVFDLDTGAAKRNWDIGFAPGKNILWDPDAGRLWVAESATGVCHRFTPTGTDEATVTLTAPYIGSGINSWFRYSATEWYITHYVAATFGEFLLFNPVADTGTRTPLMRSSGSGIRTRVVVDGSSYLTSLQNTPAQSGVRNVVRIGNRLLVLNNSDQGIEVWDATDLTLGPLYTLVPYGVALDGTNIVAARQFETNLNSGQLHVAGDLLSFPTDLFLAYGSRPCVIYWHPYTVEWNVTFTAGDHPDGVTIRNIQVPGIGTWAVSYAVDGGGYTTVDCHQPVSITVAAGSTLHVRLYHDPLAQRLEARPYIASDDGEGPILIYEDPAAVDPPPLSSPMPSPIPAGKRTEAYSYTIPWQGGYGTMSFELTAGALPAGLALDEDTGVISGTPAAAGTFSFTVTMTDGDATVVVPSGIVVAHPHVHILSDMIAAATGFETDPIQLLATGGDGVTYEWEVIDGAFPTGLVMSASGEVTGNPSDPAGTYEVELRCASGGLYNDVTLQVILAQGLPYAVPTPGVPGGIIVVNTTGGTITRLEP